MSLNNNLRRNFMKNWFAAIPIWCIVGFVVSGGAWFMARSAMGPTIQWTKANPTPWNNIQANQGTKILEVNQKFDQKWKRDAL
ncbi:hypothetical protein D9758_007445 [Tetrapyrgos nigripes]|uniref:Uncharacterized protein n=1 Tax=Tetrapyrgos nigripes TaxID=182062 RepID=A0A8H5LHU0_9AGAR|nr:hypothetical protein D9758_007445 [Tetrapyrgos nigripes]